MIRIFYSTEMNERKDSGRFLALAVESCYGKESACAIIHDEKGCPSVGGRDDIFLSVTHTGNLWACALSDRKIGIDAEFADRKVRNAEGMIDRIFSQKEMEKLEMKRMSVISPDEKNLYILKMWTEKEAFLKMKGTGFSGISKEMCTVSAENISFLSTSSAAFEEKAGSAVGRKLVFSICVEGPGRQSETAKIKRI